MSEPKTKMTLLLTPAERARLDALRLARGDRHASATLRALIRDAGGEPPRAHAPRPENTLAPPPIPSAPPDPEPMTMAERILEAIRSGRNKRHQIVDYVLHFQRPTKDSVARLLAEMKRDGEVTTTGRGRNSKWKVGP